MHDFYSAPAIVVGVDGSPAALGAALWALDEAASRAVPLKLVYVIHCTAAPGTDPTCDSDELTAAHTALREARRAVEAAAPAAGAPVDVETEVMRGNPLAALIELSRSAAMVCVGSVGLEHSCHRAGSTAAALAGAARCPVAVIHRPDTQHSPGKAGTGGHIVADLDGSPDNNGVLHWAMSEARLRSAPLRVLSSRRPRSDDPDDTDRPTRAQLSRRIGHWSQRYPDVAVESIDVPGGVARYLADNAPSIRLLVSGARDRRSLGRPGDPGGCSVLAVGGTRW